MLVEEFMLLLERLILVEAAVVGNIEIMVMELLAAQALS